MERIFVELSETEAQAALDNADNLFSSVNGLKILLTKAQADEIRAKWAEAEARKAQREADKQDPARVAPTVTVDKAGFGVAFRAFYEALPDDDARRVALGEIGRKPVSEWIGAQLEGMQPGGAVSEALIVSAIDKWSSAIEIDGGSPEIYTIGAALGFDESEIHSVIFDAHQVSAA